MIMPKAPKPAPSKTHRTEPYPSNTMAATRPNTASTLNPSTSVNVRGTAAWSPEDDQILIRARASNMNWQPIASTHFPSKTANACRKRHERLMEQHKKDDCDGVKFEAIAQAYLARREEMWKMIADMVNEKWQNVESKCMEKGLKVLQTTARSASRKGSGSSPPGTPPADENDQNPDDSGLGPSPPQRSHPGSQDPSPQHQHYSHGTQHQHQASYQQQQQQQHGYGNGNEHRNPYNSSGSQHAYNRSGSCSSTSSIYQVVSGPPSGPQQGAQRLPDFYTTFNPILQGSPVAASSFC